jgi:hypothetical protein
MRTNFTKKQTLLFGLLVSASTVFGQTNLQRQEIASKYNISKLQTLSQEFAVKAAARKTVALKEAAIQGWDEFIVNNDGSFDELMDVSVDGHPIYFTVSNVAAAKSTRANHLNTGGNLGLGLDGQNMTAYVWDGGPTRLTHQEFDGAGGNNRVSILDGVTGLNSNSFHSQHVTGTIVASGYVAASKGMAPQAKARTAEWTNDLSEATTEAANGMLISNHSYGYRSDLIPDWYFGAYMAEARDWDNLMYNSPYYLMVVAAGNDGNDNTSNLQPLDGQSSYDKLSGHATAKNNMVVANGEDANIAADGSFNSVTINSSSSEGPTDDLRIKPDITGNGTSLYSTYDNADNAYNSITGTSMASPNVAGSLLLLQQHYSNVNASFMRASTLKALALHTADDAGPAGPDAVYGWGLLNVRAAAELVSGNGSASIVDELTLSPGQTYTINVDADGVNDLVASVSWTDPAGPANTGTANKKTPVLVNDLDIRVTKGGTTYYPYKLTAVNANTNGDNSVDPYEKIEVANASGAYTVTITHKGSLSGGSQDYALVVSGVTGTPPVCSADVPTGLAASNVSSTTATLSWNAVNIANYDVQYREVGAGTWTTIAQSAETLYLTGLTVQTAYEAQVRSTCSGVNSAYSSIINFTTTEVVLNYCASKGNSVSDEWIANVTIGSFSNSTGANGGYADFSATQVPLVAGESTSLSLSPGFSGSAYNEYWKIWIDYNKNGDFDDAGELVYDAGSATSAVRTGSFTVAASATGSARIRVSMKYNGSQTSCEAFPYGEVEDYTAIFGAPEPEVCEAPTAVSASNVSDSGFDLSWTTMAFAASYDVDYKLSSGSTWTSVSATGTSKSISGLAASTSYDFRVRTVCSEGTSAYSAIGSVSTNDPAPAVYCTSSGSSGSEWIEQVIAGGVNNTSNANGGYGNYTNLTVNATQGESVSFTLNPGFSSALLFGETTQPEYWRIYVDYNGDKDFDDAGELAFDAGGTSTGNVSGSFTVPSGASVGTTRMRVSMKRSSGAAACGAIGSGEVEDYSIAISEAASLTCDAASSASATGVTSTAFTATWSASANAQSYTVDMRPTGGSWSSVSTSATSYTYTGLANETSYEFRVMTVCSFGTSAYGSTVSVSTLADNPTPVSYCSSNGQSTADEWAERVAIGSIDNNSGNNNGYADFTAQSTQAALGSSVNFTLTPGFTSGLLGASTYPEYWRIWVDYNQDGDFEDAGELAFDAGGTSTSAVSGSFTVPGNASMGNTRMRVSMSYNAAASSCESFSYGEVEDYTITIGGLARMIQTPSNVSLYPNPVTDQLNIAGVEGAMVTIADLSGRIVYQNVSNDNVLTLVAANWNSGLYIVTVKKGDNLNNMKFIVE